MAPRGTALARLLQQRRLRSRGPRGHHAVGAKRAVLHAKAGASPSGVQRLAGMASRTCQVADGWLWRQMSGFC